MRTVNMYGTVDVNLELQLDENTINTQTISLNGFSTLNIRCGHCGTWNSCIKSHNYGGGT